MPGVASPAQIVFRNRHDNILVCSTSRAGKPGARCGDPFRRSRRTLVSRGWPRSRLARHGIALALAREISEEFADALMAVLPTPEEAVNVKPYYLGMLSGHETLWAVDDFFEGVLTRLRQRLAQLGSRRYVDADGYEYWDLKPDWKPGDVVSL